MTIYVAGKKSGRTKNGRIWVRILKSSEYRQIDLFRVICGEDSNDNIGRPSTTAKNTKQ